MPTLTATWLGHATTLLDLDGRRVLVDPALEDRIGIGRGACKAGPRRLAPPAMRATELPPLALILLTHAHMDHCDLGTLAQLPRDVPVVVASGMRDLVRRFRSVTELGWGETTEVEGVRVEAFPVRHWGARLIVDRHRGYNGYRLQRSGRCVVLAGDTAVTPALGQLAAGGLVGLPAVPHPDLAVLPIGAYDPWIWNHCSPEQAWGMFLGSGAARLLPVHHATFVLSREPPGEPLARLLAAAGSGAGRIVGTQVGAVVEVGVGGSGASTARASTRLDGD